MDHGQVQINNNIITLAGQTWSECGDNESLSRETEEGGG